MERQRRVWGAREMWRGAFEDRSNDRGICRDILMQILRYYRLYRWWDQALQFNGDIQLLSGSQELRKIIDLSGLGNDVYD